MRVSIVIRVRNEAVAIKRTLALIEQQDVRADEIVVVDSGSSDGTPDIATKFSRVKLVRIRPREFTFGRALNLGIENARGTS
jgi:glycosyltransferase involved in cell wall biosynthesis